MPREKALRILQEHRAQLALFGVKSLGLFGSVARNEAKPESDLDLLVEFDKPVGLFEFVRLQMHLASLFGHDVDLVTSDALRPIMRPQIMAEVIYA